MEAGQAFRTVVKGQNFITPTVIRYGRVNGFVYELSKGRGIFDPLSLIYGVTVVKGLTNRYDLSQGGFDSLEKAEGYIKSLEEKY